MDDKHTYTTTQLLNFTKDSYLERTARPIYALLFLLPFIVFYELGTIFINTDLLSQSQLRVVAFVWLEQSLEYLGFGRKLAWMAPPLAVVIILFALQLASRKRWVFNHRDILPMAVECIFLAVPLIVLSLLLNSPPPSQADTKPLASHTIQIQSKAAVPCSVVLSENSPTIPHVHNEQPPTKSLLADIVTSIGAGIYEELVFRLILICAFMILFQDVFRFGYKNSIISAVLISAALFSAHHHIVFISGRLAVTAPFNWTEFSFRTIAGIYFAVLFAVRGFGITAGTHAFYDVMAVFINTYFFDG